MVQKIINYLNVFILTNLIILIIVFPAVEKPALISCPTTPIPSPTGKTCSASPKDLRSSLSGSESRKNRSPIEGQFTLPELARLTLEDQVFVVAFLRSHGTIKDMEQTFGVSYPTIKARLNRISSQLEFVETNPVRVAH